LGAGARRPHPSGGRIALPGGREAVAHFGELRLGPRATPRAPFALALTVPGEVTLPDGARVVARPAREADAAADGEALCAAPEGRLEVRTRHAGDRVRGGSGEISLRRFLVDRRVPAGERDRVPVVAAGRRVVWVAGLPAPAAARGDRWVRLALVPAGATA
jgi:tRNA(Ile)-lysidine synthase